MRARNAALVSGAGVYRSDEALMRTSASARRSLTPCEVISRTSTRRAGAVTTFFAMRRAYTSFSSTDSASSFFSRVFSAISYK